MAEGKPPKDTQQGKEEPSGLGYRRLAMNPVAPSLAQEPTRRQERRGRPWLIFLVVVIGAAGLAWVAGRLANLHPGAEAEARLRTRLQGLEVWQMGTLVDARYLAGNKVRLQLGSHLVLETDEGRNAARQAALEAMDQFMQERPDRDLYIEGYQGEEQVLRAEYRRRSALLGPDGQPVPDVVVRVKGDPEGGLGAVVREGTREVR